MQTIRPPGGAAFALAACLIAPAATAPEESPAAARREVRYEIQPVDGGLDGLRERFEPWQIDRLEMLNRRDRRHLGQADGIVVPREWHDDPLADSPVPLVYSWADAHPKALVVHQPGQVFGAYEHGRLVRWGPVSSGRAAHPTPAGLFHLNWRSRGRRSTVNPEWYMPWYFNFENFRGLSFHEHPLPGRPASHACIRLIERDARWIYHWGEGWVLDEREEVVLEHGTPVLIIGHYDFDAPPPWESVEWVERGISLPERPRLERHDPEP